MKGGKVWTPPIVVTGFFFPELKFSSLGVEILKPHHESITQPPVDSQVTRAVTLWGHQTKFLDSNVDFQEERQK